MAIEKKLIADIGSIGRYKVRVVQFGKRVGLDIREYITAETFVGYTKKGVFVSEQDLPELLRQVHAGKAVLDKDLFR